MKIETYLKEKQDVLDVHQPNKDAMWEVIRQKQLQKKQKLTITIRWIAAMLVLSFVVGALVRHEMVVQEQITSLSQINTDLAQREKHYQQMVNEKWAQFTTMPGAESPIEPMLLEELKKLDTLYQKGFDELVKTGYNERAVILLLDTYEKRLHIIEQLIYEKRKQKSYENKHQEYDI